MLEYITLFTIGPVQSFIAKARKLQDLYAGSYLLSHLSLQTMRRAEDLGAVILFPDLSQLSAPNRFLMKVKVETVDTLRTFCAGLEQYVRDEWIGVAKKVIGATGLDYSPAVAAQIESLLQVYYASEEHNGGEQFGEDYIKIVQRLGAAKMLRSFTQLDEDSGRKCNLMYEHNALFYREKKPYLVEAAQQVKNGAIRDLNKYIQPDETLGAVAFVKRCLKFALNDFDDSFPSVTNIYMRDNEHYDDRHELGQDDEKLLGYYAIVMFDGDDMGMWYSEPNGVNPERVEEFQSYLSSRISEFAGETVRKVVDWENKKNGRVIYAGGEDFLGALNIKCVFPALQELRETFGRIELTEFTEGKPTFSAGVAIAHVKTPLSDVLRMAREAEYTAKDHPGKDAFCLTIAKHSGDVTRFVQPFYYGETSSLAMLDKLVGVIVKEGLSVKFIYQLGEELSRMAETGDAALHREVFLAEAERLLRHSEFENEAKRNDVVKNVMGMLDTIAADSGFGLANLLAYLRAIAFLAKERGRRNEGAN